MANFHLPYMMQKDISVDTLQWVKHCNVNATLDVDLLPVSLCCSGSNEDSVQKKLFPSADFTCCVRTLLSRIPLSKQVRFYFSDKVIFTIFIPKKTCLHSKSSPNNTWLFLLPFYQTTLSWGIQTYYVPFTWSVCKSDHFGGHLYISQFNCIILFAWK